MNQSRRLPRTHAGVWTWRVLVICRKELLQFLRNPVILIFLVYSFTMSIYDSAVSIRRELRNASMVVIDNDHSQSSRELIHRFRQPYFRRRGELESAGQGIRLLDEGEIMMVLDIPPQFERNLREGRGGRVQLQLDGSHANLAYLASSYAGQIVQGFGQEFGQELGQAPGRELVQAPGQELGPAPGREPRAGVGSEAAPIGGSAVPASSEQLPVIENQERVWFNPNRDETLFRALEEMAQHILLFSLLLPAAAMAREKERGTVEQLLVSPLNPLQIMLGKILPMTVIILLATAASLGGIVQGVLQLQLRGSIPLFFAVTALFSFATCSLGILIASVTRNIAQVGIVSIMLMPVMLLLSGSDTPPEMMPRPLLPVMYASPMHHYLNAVYGILLKGAGLDVVWDSVLYMSLLGGGMFLFSLARFRTQFRSAH